MSRSGLVRPPDRVDQYATTNQEQQDNWNNRDRMTPFSGQGTLPPEHLWRPQSTAYRAQVLQSPHARQEKIGASAHGNELGHVHDTTAHSIFLRKPASVGKRADEHG